MPRKKKSDLPPPLPPVKPQSAYDLMDWLDAVIVIPPGAWENDDGPRDWYAVANEDGIIAYFGEEVDACRFRLDYINRKLCP